MGLFRKKKKTKDIASASAEQSRVAGERHFFRQGHTVKTALAVLTALCIYSIFTHGRVSTVVTLTLGQMSPGDIYATADFRFIDEELADRLKEKSTMNIMPVYTVNVSAMEESAAAIAAFLADLATIARDESLPFDDKLARAKDKASGKISDEDIGVLLKSGMDKAEADNVVALYRDIMKNGIVHQGDKVAINQQSGDRLNMHDPVSGKLAVRSLNSIISLEDSQDYAFWRAKQYFANQRLVRSVVNYLLNFMAVNVSYDKERTDALKKAVREGIKSEYTYVKKGQIIIRRGEEVGRKHISEMKALADTESRSLSKEEKWFYRLGIILLIVVGMALFANYLKFFEPGIFDDNLSLLQIAAIFVLAIGFSKAILYVNQRVDILWLKSLVVVPFASILYIILFNRRIAFILTVVLSIVLGLMNANRIDFVIIGFAGGVAGIIAAEGMKHRWQIFKVGFTVSVVNIVVLLAFQAMGDFDPYRFMFYAISGFAGGMLSAFFAAFFIPVFEYVFNIPTDLKLLEFLDLNHPLLKDMVIEAPGTYHHSLMVGNLAEAAASGIGANPLLAKVAAYFHDVGKLLKPEYFSENEEYGKSYHRGLNPSMSSLIILSHVKDGADLARKYKLPEVIIDILKAHHGTSLVYYFFKKAEAAAPLGDAVGEENYRYKGPRPHLKEAGIVLLADAVEAASRSLEKPTASRIENMVKEIIGDKIKDNQLDECDITFREISVIEDIFTRVLTAAYHSRIKYPKEGELEDAADEGGAQPRRGEAT
ncbi:MAG TPA: HDIG domain-containing protein [bacterium]|nr:HDIG domain-containing protein [bacterium]